MWTLSILAVTVAALALVAGVYFAGRDRAPDPPQVSTAGLEPAIVDLLSTAAAEVRASPRSGAAWGKLGLALQPYEFKTEARHCFEQAGRIESDNPRWPYFLGLLLLQEDPTAGITRLRRAAELNRGRTDAPRLRLAQALMEQGQLEDARQTFAALLEAHPAHAPARLGLAQVNLTLGKLADSSNQVAQCLNDVHTAKGAHTLLAAIQQRLGQSAGAQTTALKAARLPPDRPWPDPFHDEAAQFHVGRKAFGDRGQQMLDQGRVEEALPLIQRLVTQYASAPEGWLLLARARFELKDCAASERAARQHLQLQADSVNGQAQLGLALLCQEQYAEAGSAFEKVIQLKPDFGEAHFNLGFARARTGRAMEAIPCFREAIRYNPNFVDPYITLADLLHQLGQSEEAVAHLRRALELDPADERARALLQRIQK